MPTIFFKMLKMHRRVHHSPHKHALLQLIEANTPSHIMLTFPLLPDLLPLSAQPQESRLRTSKDLVLQYNHQRLMRLDQLTSLNTAVVLLTVDPRGRSAGLHLALRPTASLSEGNSYNSKADYTQQMSNLVHDRGQICKSCWPFGILTTVITNQIAPL